VIAGHSWCNGHGGRVSRKAPAPDSFRPALEGSSAAAHSAYDDDVPDPRAVVDTWESLFRAQVAVLRDVTSDFPIAGLAMIEYDLLFNLSRLPARRARPRDLNQYLLISQPSVSRLIDRLAHRGLVTKTPDEDDGRGIVVALTDEGYAAYRRAAAQHGAAIVARFGDRLDEGELAALARLCDRLRE